MSGSYSWEWFFTAALPLIIYILFDIFCFMKMGLYYYIARHFQTRKKPWETTTIYGLCWTQDVDVYLTHMNNNRMAREMDFAAYYSLSRSRLSDVAAKTIVWKNASTLRFRRPVPLFSIYKINTKIIYWEKDALFLEQQFMTRDNFVRAVVMSKFVMHGVDMQEILDCERPEATDEMHAWLSSMDCSSKRLRPIGSKID